VLSNVVSSSLVALPSEGSSLAWDFAWDFEFASLPSDCDLSSLPCDLESSSLPSDFESASLPLDFESASLLCDYDSLSLPWDFKSSCVSPCDSPSSLWLSSLSPLNVGELEV
jgi:hypothetical protein